MSPKNPNHMQKEIHIIYDVGNKVGQKSHRRGEGSTSYGSNFAPEEGGEMMHDCAGDVCLSPDGLVLTDSIVGENLGGSGRADNNNNNVTLSIVNEAGAAICSIEASLDMKVESLKALIQEKIGMLHECQALSTAQKNLDRNLQLRSFSVVHKDAIFLSYRHPVRRKAKRRK